MSCRKLRRHTRFFCACVCAQGYASTVITIVKPAGSGGADGGDGQSKSSAVVVEDGVTIEVSACAQQACGHATSNVSRMRLSCVLAPTQYEGRRLEIQTILEEEELAPLFDGAYWPGRGFVSFITVMQYRRSTHTACALDLRHHGLARLALDGRVHPQDVPGPHAGGDLRGAWLRMVGITLKEEQDRSCVHV